MLVATKKPLRKPHRLLSLCAALLYLSFGSASATNYPLQSINIHQAHVLSKQVDSAQLIFEGTVADIRVRLSHTTQTKQIAQAYSFFSFDITRIIKGSIISSNNTLTLPTKGINETTIEDSLKLGKRVDFFLRKNNQDVLIYSYTGSAEHLFDNPQTDKTFNQVVKKYAINKNSTVILRLDDGNELLIQPSRHSIATPSLKKGDHIILMVGIDPKTQQATISAEQGIDVLNFPKTPTIWIGPTGKILFDDANLAPKDKKPYTANAFAQVVTQKIEQTMRKHPNHEALIPIASVDANQPIYEDDDNSTDTQRDYAPWN
jgi:peptidase E